MKHVSGLFVLLCSSICYADHLNVLVFDLKEHCTVPEYMAFVEDVNEWGKDIDYQTEIAVPLQSDDLSALYEWIAIQPLKSLVRRG